MIWSIWQQVYFKLGHTALVNLSLLKAVDFEFGSISLKKLLSIRVLQAFMIECPFSKESIRCREQFVNDVKSIDVTSNKLRIAFFDFMVVIISLDLN